MSDVTKPEAGAELKSGSGSKKRSRKRARSALVRWLIQYGPLLAAGLPALIIGLGAGSVAMAVLLNRDLRPAHYTAAAYSRAGSKDLEGAKVCFERLLRLNSGTDKTKFNLAQIYQQSGQPERALSMISELAPLDKTGHPPAHLVMAVYLLNRREISEANLLQAETHLKRVLEAGTGESENARMMLAQLYARSGRTQEAKVELTTLVQSRPELLLQLAALERSMGSEIDATTHAEKAFKTFSDRTLEEPNNLNNRVLSAGAAAFLKQYPKSESILLDALAKGDNRDIHSALAGLYLIWADDVMKDPQNGPSSWLPLLERGIRHEPKNPLLLDRFLTIINKHGRDNEETRSAMMDMLSDGKAPASAHFLLGVDAWQRQKPEEARFHWERAHELAPELVGASNNLAWVLASGANPDLPRALEIINLALDRSPKNPTYLGTRGRVLVRMEQWKDAVNDLEAALTSTPDDIDLHKDLATAYKGLGMTDLAARHEERAEKPQPTGAKP